MRLWSIHPVYLDSKGLVALWREGLLAQKVLLGRTKGYRNHPQLIRFRRSRNPVGTVASYLRIVVDEADRRGYKFDRSKISKKRYRGTIDVTNGQLDYEFNHLLKKLKSRAPELYIQNQTVREIEAHPLLHVVNGGVEEWEIV